MQTFNWTKVELKLVDIEAEPEQAGPFNWTKVELKLHKTYFTYVVSQSFNWTKVELKRILRRMKM